MKLATLIQVLVLMLCVSPVVFADNFVHLNTDASKVQDLVCSAEQMSDPSLYSFTWFRNDELYVSDSNVVPASDLTKGEVWTCEVRTEGFSGTIKIGEDTTTIVNAPPVIISTPVTTGNVGTSYNYDVNAVDADGDSLTYALVSSIPSMTIIPATGMIVWNPATAGTYNVIVSVTDGTATVLQSFVITVGNGVGGPITLTASATPNTGNIPLGVNFASSASGGTGPYTYAWDFTNDGTYDIVSQNPFHSYSVNGTFIARVNVTDALGQTAQQLLTITATVNAPPALSVTAFASTNSGTAPLSVTFGSNVLGGTLPYTYRWDFTNDGTYDSTAISPTFNYATNGTYTARLNVTDATGQTGQALVTIIVAPVGSVGPSFTTTSCPDGTVNVAYTCDINANNAANYTLTSSPSGMSINQNTGVVSWTPSSTGTYTFTVRATASNGLFADRSFTIHITGSSNNGGNSNEGDLLINSIEFDSDTVQQGSQVIAHVSMENDGNTDFNDLTVTMSIDELGVIDSTSKFDLQSNDKKTQSLEFVLPSNVASGTYDVRFTIKNDDVSVTKYRELVIKGTSAVISNAPKVVVTPTLSSYQPPVQSEKTNWFGIWFMILLFLALLVLAIYMTKKAMESKNTNEAVVSFENEVM